MRQNAPYGMPLLNGSAAPTVSVLCVTTDRRAASLISDDLRSAAPNYRVETSPGIEQALIRLMGTPEPEAVLIGADVPEKEALRLIAAVRRRSWPIAIILLLAPPQDEPPIKVLEAGADDYVVRRPGAEDRLHDVLQRAIARHCEDAELRQRPINVLVVGDFGLKQRHLGYLPYFRLVTGSVGADGRVEGLPAEDPEETACDLLLIDDVITMPRVLQALKDVQFRAPDVPVVLMLDPNSGDAAIQAYKLGAAECIVKAGNHYHRLAPVLRNIVHLRDVFRERRTLRTTETRLRVLIETVPASVTVLTRTGAFMGLNRAGLPLLGARSPEQIVGRHIGTLVSPKEGPRVASFLEGICAGGRGTIKLDCTGIDGIVRRLELRAVPLRREPERTITVLGVLREASNGTGCHEGGEQEGERAMRDDLLSTSEALKAAEARLAARDEEYRREREAADQARRDLESRLQNSEARRVELEQALARARQSLSSPEMQPSSNSKRL